MTDLSVEITVKPACGMDSYTEVRNIQDLKANILAGHPVLFTAAFVTKTQIGTTIQCGGAGLKMNLDIEGFNLRENEEYSYQVGHFTYFVFKLTKKQGKEEYLNYIRAGAEKIFKELGIERQQQSFILATDAFEV